MTNGPGVELIGMRAVAGTASSSIDGGGMRNVCGPAGAATGACGRVMIGGGGIGDAAGALGGAGGVTVWMRTDARLMTASGFDGWRALAGALFGGSGTGDAIGARGGGGGLLAGPRGASGAFGASGALGADDALGGGADETRTAGSGDAGRFPIVLRTEVAALGSPAIGIRKFQVA